MNYQSNSIFEDKKEYRINFVHFEKIKFENFY